MKVLTFNIWDIVIAKDRALRRRALCERLAAAAADPEGWDVVFLQEAWAETARRRLARCYPHAADADRFDRDGAGRLARLLAGGVDSGLLTLSRWPIAEVRRRDYSVKGRWSRVHRDGEAVARKGALAARVGHPELGDVWAVNTHLIADHPGESYLPERLIQLEELAAFLGQLAREAPVILGGDLNCGPALDGPNCGYFPEVWPDRIADFLPGYTQSAGAESFATWDTAANTYRDCRGGPARLDHIFVSAGLEASDGQLAFADPVDLGDGRRRHLSDHYGWSCRVTGRR